MGIDFRGSYYHRYVRFGKRTIKEGEAAAIWDINGRHRQVVGPRLVRLWFSAINFLDCFRANPSEYLVVSHSDGRVEHIRGPVSLYRNPVFHQAVQVQSLVQLHSPGECIVVYRRSDDTAAYTAAQQTAATNNDGGSSHQREKGAVVEAAKVVEMPPMGATKRDIRGKQRVIRGPAAFMPEVDEYIHSFEWAINNGKPVQVLLTTDQRCPANVNITTADQMEMTVYLTVRYRIPDIEATIAVSRDPLQDIFAALEADASAAGAQLTRETMRDSMRAIFGNAETYPRALERATAVGIDVSEIVFQKYSLSAKMQRDADELERLQTKLQKERLEAQERETRTNSELAARKARIQQEQELQSLEQQHEINLRAQQEEADVNMRAKSNDEILAFLERLHGLGVDLTKFLTHIQSHADIPPVLASAPVMAQLTFQASKPPAPGKAQSPSASTIAVEHKEDTWQAV